MTFSIFGNLFTDLFFIHRFCQHVTGDYTSYFNKKQNELLKQLKQDGLKKYSQKYVDCSNAAITSRNSNDHDQKKDTSHEQHQTLTIQILDIITTQYPKLYRTITSYNTDYINDNNCNKKYYYNKFFDNSYLVLHTFKYIGDLACLNKCCLVDSVWLMYAFHPSCLHTFSFDTLRNAHKRLLKLPNVRSWQRFHLVRQLILLNNCDGENMSATNSWLNGFKSINLKCVKHVIIFIRLNGGAFDQCLSSLLNTFNRVGQITNNYNNYNNDDNSGIFSSSTCAQRQLWLDSHSEIPQSRLLIPTDEMEIDLSLFDEINLHHTCTITNSHMIISHNCEKLRLRDNNSIYVQKSCLNRLKVLSLWDCKFPKHSENEIKDLSFQCENVIQFTICNPNKQTILWWISMNQYLCKNKACVALILNGKFNQQTMSTLKTSIQKHKLRVTKIDISFFPHTDVTILDTCKLQPLDMLVAELTEKEVENGNFNIMVKKSMVVNLKLCNFTASIFIKLIQNISLLHNNIHHPSYIVIHNRHNYSLTIHQNDFQNIVDTLHNAIVSSRIWLRLTMDITIICEEKIKQDTRRKEIMQDVDDIFSKFRQSLAEHNVNYVDKNDHDQRCKRFNIPQTSLTWQLQRFDKCLATLSCHTMERVNISVYN